MDELSEGFGQLSTTAKEWKPSSSSSTMSDRTSLLPSFGSDRTSSIGSSAGQNATPLSPLPPKSPMRLPSALQHTPPGRSAMGSWQPQQMQQQQHLTSPSWRSSPQQTLQQSPSFGNAMASPSAASWNPPQQQLQPPAWPDSKSREDPVSCDRICASLLYAHSTLII